MKKLKLNVAALRVESFASAEASALLGTVHAHSTAYPNPATCAAVHTCDGAVGYCDPFSGICGSGMPDC